MNWWVFCCWTRIERPTVLRAWRRRKNWRQNCSAGAWRAVSGWRCKAIGPGTTLYWPKSPASRARRARALRSGAGGCAPRCGAAIGLRCRPCKPSSKRQAASMSMTQRCRNWLRCAIWHSTPRPALRHRQTCRRPARPHPLRICNFVLRSPRCMATVQPRFANGRGNRPRPDRYGVAAFVSTSRRLAR